jgi:hypothetical protein
MKGLGFFDRICFVFPRRRQALHLVAAYVGYLTRDFNEFDASSTIRRA